MDLLIPVNHGYMDTWIHRYFDILITGYMDTYYLGAWIPGYSYLINGFIDTCIPWIHGYIDTLIYGYLLPGYLGTWIVITWIPRYLDTLIPG